MEVTDTKYLKEIEKQQEEMARREQRKSQKRGWIGRWFSFENHIKTRDKRNITTIEETKGKYGRAGNRVYLFSDKHDMYFLDKKFKNSTKAKKFMKGLL